MDATEFTLANIPGLADLWDDAVQDVINDIIKKGGSGARKITLTATFEVFAGNVVLVTPGVKASFPQGDKQEAVGVKCLLRDGRLWMQSDEQPRMFTE